MKRLLFSAGILALVSFGCATQSNQGGAGTTSFEDRGMSSKMEIGRQKVVGPDPEESSPSTRYSRSSVAEPNAPDRGDQGPAPGAP